jgi:hypothetical protein
MDEAQVNTYADPPSINPELTAQQRQLAGRARRREMPWESVVQLTGSSTDPWAAVEELRPEMSSGLVVLVGGPRAMVHPVVDRGVRYWDFMDVDDMLPMSFEVDLIGHGVRLAAMVRRRDRRELVEQFCSAYSKALFASLAKRRSDWAFFGNEYSASLGRGQLAKMPTTTLISTDSAVSVFVRHSELSLRAGRLARWWGVDRDGIDDGGVFGFESEFAQFRETLSDSSAAALADYRVVQSVANPQGDVVVLLVGAQKSDLLLMHGRAVRESPFERRWGLWRQGSDIQRVLVARSSLPVMPWEFTGWSTSPDGIVGRVWSRLRWSASAEAQQGAHPGPRVDLHAVAQGACLGLAHARTGDAWALAGYLGKSNRSARTLARAVVEYTG